MGNRECFIYTKDNSCNVEQIAKALIKHKKFRESFPKYWINCKTKANININKDSTKIFGKQVKINPINISAGQEMLCIGHANDADIKSLFSRKIRKKLNIVDSIELGLIDYKETFTDYPITIDNQIYMAALIKE